VALEGRANLDTSREGHPLPLPNLALQGGSGDVTVSFLFLLGPNASTAVFTFLPPQPNLSNTGQ
jgi:hypothetical protein